ncbi:MAG: efflux RND transporter periplasmic adaptor subunit [Caulobacteraceae bacterium]|nr:efflux RND transporter periplasmic adaptor subunit [Caulobacteraceae bacterium]
MFGLFRRFGFAAIVVAGLALMVLVVVGKSASDAVFGGDGAATASPAQGGRGGGGGGGGGNAPTVLAVAADIHTFSDGLQAIGTAQARESIVLTPKVADTIRRIRFDSGDNVRAGQVLVEMSSVEQAADMAEARASNQAAQEDLRRTQELFNRGFASQARLDTVQAAADAAEARLNAGGSRIADRTIRAPFAGVVGLRLASPGQYVRPGDQIGTLDDTSEIKLDFTITETQIARIVPGVQLVARTTAYPGRDFTGSIASVDSRIDPATRTGACPRHFAERRRHVASRYVDDRRCAFKSARGLGNPGDRDPRSDRWRLCLSRRRPRKAQRWSLSVSAPASAPAAWPRCWKG